MNELCLDDKANRLFVSTSSELVLAVVLLANDEDVRCRTGIGGRTVRVFVETIANGGKSSSCSV